MSWPCGEETGYFLVLALSAYARYYPLLNCILFSTLLSVVYELEAGWIDGVDELGRIYCWQSRSSNEIHIPPNFTFNWTFCRPSEKWPSVNRSFAFVVTESNSKSLHCHDRHILYFDYPDTTCLTCYSRCCAKGNRKCISADFRTLHRPLSSLSDSSIKRTRIDLNVEIPILGYWQSEWSKRIEKVVTCWSIPNLLSSFMSLANFNFK